MKALSVIENGIKDILENSIKSIVNHVVTPPHLQPRRSRESGNPVKYANPQGFSTCNTTQRGSCAVSLALLLISAIALTACGGGSGATSGATSSTSGGIRTNPMAVHGIGNNDDISGSVTRSSRGNNGKTLDIVHIKSGSTISRVASASPDTDGFEIGKLTVTLANDGDNPTWEEIKVVDGDYKRINNLNEDYSIIKLKHEQEIFETVLRVNYLSY